MSKDNKKRITTNIIIGKLPTRAAIKSVDMKTFRGQMSSMFSPEEITSMAKGLPSTTKTTIMKGSK